MPRCKYCHQEILWLETEKGKRMPVDAGEKGCSVQARRSDDCEGGGYVHTELDWVPANITQAEDRCHRIGQAESVNVYHLVLDESLDQRLAETLISKQEVMDKALDIDAEAEVTDEPAVPTAEKRVRSKAYPPATDEERQAALDGLRHLAGFDADGAQFLNDVGYNKIDTNIGRKLARLDRLTDGQVWLAKKILQKYRRQLPDEIYGILFGSDDDNNPGGGSKPSPTSEFPAELKELADRGATFFINHSGGKDSQAMTAFVRRHVSDNQIVIVHAHLPEVEWPGVIEHIKETTQGLRYIEAHAVKTFFEMVDHRGRWPSPAVRQCTSDLKRGPIEREIRRFVKESGNNLIVQCLGLRAEESPNRAKAVSFQFDERNSKAGREWYNWLPLHGWTVGQVFKEIEDAGQRPHWAYEAGMTRLSCCFCIMASKEDLRTAARLRPDLYRRYVDKEKELGHTFCMPRKGHEPEGLEAVTGIKAGRAARAMRRAWEIRRAAALRFGCKVGEIDWSSCLKLAWAEVKAHTTAAAVQTAQAA